MQSVELSTFEGETVGSLGSAGTQDVSESSQASGSRCPSVSAQVDVVDTCTHCIVYLHNIFRLPEL